MRGFLGGVSVGALLAAGGLAMLSLSVPMTQKAAETGSAADTGTAPVEPQPAGHSPGGAPEMPNGGEATEVPGSGQAKDADLVEVQPAAPAASQASDDLSALDGADTAPAGKPEVGLAAAAQNNGGPEAASPPGVEQPAGSSLPQAQQPALPAVPGDESAVVAATEPAPAPESPKQETVAVESAAGDGKTLPQQAVAEPAVQPAAEAAAVLAPDIGSAPQATTLPVISAAPALPAAADGADAGLSGDDAEETAQAAASGAENQESAAPKIGTPVIPLTERNKAQETGGLSQESPFAAFAEPFSNPDNRPLMSIVLIDDAGAVGAEALAEFPYPLSFAIDPEDPEAQAKMAARRSAGFEVLMLADLPRGASPQDAETALEVWRGNLPEAVAIMEGVDTGVQGNRPLADQVAAVAASAGFGLITQNSGLNTVQKLALRDGVPAGVVFRDFDGAGQNPRAIRRFLDQAAFRAGQEGAVIMLGRLRPDTVSALLIWGLQDRASRVALAPVSASLEAKLPK
ncbi:polysaccharide deacetylase [Leisingera sp. ANG-M1]|uniref:divergent polysaccharide deacetylase family protein n=1 Tax=Leisingera sp. ANG-M1 TaxID=1577895 RepID=UPI00057DCC5A|nr:divergent polysaccharide deacetylase family protein [Leisingera sp. ANG-M1]KIC08428.1 polysaccharide deacetylase [Leisingera sp. ANG-M1]